mgnify:CR=1 FL=1
MITDLEKDFLLKKIKEAIVYQSYFGEDSDEKTQRIADNCCKLFFKFIDIKINNNDIRRDNS